jgi:hypothetical protein
MKWKEHTSTEQFAMDFKKIMDKYQNDNDERAREIEDFMIMEAKKIGVVKI